MEAYEGQEHQVKRVVLPSGQTIEVVYFAGESASPPVEPTTAEPDQDLHVCLECAGQLVYPMEWEESGSDNWAVLLHCPNCDFYREGIFGQATVEAFDEYLDRGADALARDYKRLMRANLADEIDRFAGALHADAIVPEDF
jgi:hypothetical protein